MATEVCNSESVKTARQSRQPVSETIAPAPQGRSTHLYRRWFMSLVLSTGFHLLIVLILAQFVMSHPAEPAHMKLDTSWMDDAAVEVATLEQVEIETSTIVEQSSPTNSIAETVPQEVTVPNPTFNESLPALEQSWESELDSLDLTGSVGEWSKAGKSGVGTGGLGLFRENLTGKNIVYVVDSSASMNSPYPGREKHRFGRVKIELIRAIRSMSPDRKFYIIFFNTEAIPMPGRRMIPASNKAADDALIWMSKQVADGETDPSQAIQLAVSMKPDVIHFLTDGEIDPRLIQSVREMNRSGVSINTYCISNRDGEKVVLKIAKQNNGAYKFVP